MKSKKVLSLILSMILIMTCMSVNAETNETDTSLFTQSDIWDGTISEPAFDSMTSTYIITNGAELAWVSAVVGEKITSGTNFPSSATFSRYIVRLANDILLNDTSNWQDWNTSAPANIWTPIGGHEMISSTTDGYYGVLTSFSFKGIFDGDGHTVSGIYFNNTLKDYGQYAGLFGYTVDGIIKNVGVTNSLICGNNYVGCIAGYNDETLLINCNCEGNISGMSFVGGIAGFINGDSDIGKIENCINKASVSGYASNVGGIAGANFSNIKNCRNTGSVSGNKYVGGITAESYDGFITNCSNEGEISGSDYVGGIAGHNFSHTIIANCSNLNTVSGTAQCIGGIAGFNELCTIKNSYNTSAVNGDFHIGGVVGLNSEAKVKNCYNTGGISGRKLIGGVVGGSTASNYNSPIILNCYNTGMVSGSEENIGAVIGYNSGYSTSMAYITNCYALSGTAVTLFNNYNEYAVISETSFLSDEQMKNQENFKNFDFHNIWAIEPLTGYEYPQLMKSIDISYGENAAIWDGSIADSFESGSGIENDPYIITTAEQLALLANYVNAGKWSYQKANYKLGADIVFNNYNSKYWTATATEWTPIGREEFAFVGVFDGDGHTVSGLYISAGYFSGLFGYSESSTVKNVCLLNSYIGGDIYVGGLIGLNADSTISNCYNTGTVDGGEYVGGITGKNEGTLTKCYNTGTINGVSHVGGLIGYNQTYSSTVTVINCYNTGEVSGYLNLYAGGIVGYNYAGRNCMSKIENCYSTGIVRGSGKSVGAVVGINKGYSTDYMAYIKNCYAISGTNNSLYNNSNGYVSVLGVSFLTDAQMKVSSNFSGFDFETVWEIGTASGYYYPTLCIPPRLTGITITAVPIKTTYYEGEIFDAMGMAVTAVYEDGINQEITDYSFLPDTALTADKTSIKILYLGKFAYVNITIKENSYTYDFTSNTLVYDSFAAADAKVIFAAYKNGEIIDIEIKDVTVSVGSNSIVPESFMADGADTVKVMVWSKANGMKPLGSIYKK